MKCPDCDGKIKIGLTNCPDCGRSLGNLDLAQLKSDSDMRKKKILSLIATVAILMSGGVATKIYLNDQRDKRIAIEQAEKAKEELRLAQEAEEEERRRLQEEKEDYSWVPSGYSKFALNYNMAWKKIGYDAADCYSWCLGMQVVSRDYCSSIQLEANFVRNGVILDSASDFASDIPAGTPRIMKLVTSIEGATNTVFTEVRCT
jgi:hypothetical protein